MQQFKMLPTREKVSKGLDFIMSHFPEEESPHFPRTASTFLTTNSQHDVYSIEHALEMFETSEWFDCKLNGYRNYTFLAKKGQIPGVMYLKKCFCL